MKYTNFSELPIHAFQPRLGRGPFSHGMTLEGGGGGFVGEFIDNTLGSVGDFVDNTVSSIGDAATQLDKSVNDAVPGGWATVAAVAIIIAAPYAAPYLMAEAGISASAAAALEAAAIAEGATTAAPRGGASRGGRLTGPSGS